MGHGDPPELAPNTEKALPSPVPGSHHSRLRRYAAVRSPETARDSPSITQLQEDQRNKPSWQIQGHSIDQGPLESVLPPSLPSLSPSFLIIQETNYVNITTSPAVPSEIPNP